MKEMNNHIAILYRYYLELILKKEKTIEARFSNVKQPPFGKVFKGDRIFIKETGGPIRGEAEVNNVNYYSNLSHSKIFEIVNKYKDQLRIKDDFLNIKLESKYLTLIFLQNVKKVNPYNIKKKDRRAWVVLKNHERIFDFF